jgi:anaerobic magnesium-protoporphyrin IX monomethyl ester cyclase
MGSSKEGGTNQENKNNFKILFIYPNVMMGSLLPINISLLSACVRRAGFDARLFDTTFYRTAEKSFDQVKFELLQVKKFSYEEVGVHFKETDLLDDLDRLLDSYRPDLVAITVVQDTLPQVRDMVTRIHHRHIPTIAGGVHVTLNPDEVLSIDGIDMICVGEGEEALVELCERLDRGEDIRDIRNLWIKTPEGVVKNPMRPVVDLDRLPFIEFDLFEKERIYRPMQGKIYAMLHVEIDRGCPYQCTYCSSPQLTRVYREQARCRYYRQKSVDRIIEEITYLVKKYNPGYIDFNAESFLARPVKDLRRLADRYRTEIGLPFWVQSRPETVTDEKVRILKEMGCKNLQFGIECGNEEFRRRMLKRNYTNEQMLSAFRAVEKHGIEYTVNNIIGFPDETRELIFDTIRFNRLIRPTTMNVYIFTAYRGTELYHYCVEQGYMQPDAPSHQPLEGTPLACQPLAYEEIRGLQRTFPLYARFPETDWPRIARAEQFDEEGNRLYDELKREFYQTASL